MIGSGSLSNSITELKVQFKNPTSHCISKVKHKAIQRLWRSSEQ